MHFAETQYWLSITRRTSDSVKEAPARNDGGKPKSPEYAPGVGEGPGPGDGVGAAFGAVDSRTRAVSSA